MLLWLLVREVANGRLLLRCWRRGAIESARSMRRSQDWHDALQDFKSQRLLPDDGAAASVLAVAASARDIQSL